jgi:hypothetical protein
VNRGRGEGSHSSLAAARKQRKGIEVELTEMQRDLLFAAWATGRDGNGIVIENHAYPDAHDLAELGWLERRFTSECELAWFWTAQAEQALDLSALMQSTECREN